MLFHVKGRKEGGRGKNKSYQREAKDRDNGNKGYSVTGTTKRGAANLEADIAPGVSQKLG